MNILKRKLAVLNSCGICGSPSGRIVKLIYKHKVKATFSKEPFMKGQPAIKADGLSVMDLMMLEASQGTILLVEIEGDNAHIAMEELTSLFNNGFYRQNEDYLPIPQFHNEYVV